MFCPVCKSEYRDGFTKCSDCGVDLLAGFPDGSISTDSEELEILWAGQDAGTQDEICERLATKNIFYNNDAVESKLMPAFRQSIYRIQIRKRDHDAALQAIQDVSSIDSEVRKSPGFILDRNSDLLNKIGFQNRVRRGEGLSSERSSARESPAEAPDSDESDRSQEAAPDDVLENFDPNEATYEVWSGDDNDLAQTFEDCFREVGIGCAVATVGGRLRVFVLPSAQSRANEIIREIVEQTPPE